MKKRSLIACGLIALMGGCAPKHDDHNHDHDDHGHDHSYKHGGEGHELSGHKEVVSLYAKQLAAGK